LPLHQQAGFFQYLGHHTTANLTGDVVGHAQIFQDTGNTTQFKFYHLGTGILNPVVLLAGLELGSNSTNTENVTISQLNHVHKQGITNEGQ
jgi:hypothetical protein